jgi:predicted TIM-barrel fold metal-dependent hydrolase
VYDDVDQASWLERSVRRHFDPDRHAPLGQVGHCPLMTGKLLNLLADWVPEETARRRILSANPARLYGFARP